MSPAVLAQFAFASLLPVAASVVLRSIEQRTGIEKSRPALWQGIVGVVFGLIAIFGTEMGISTEDATMNVRDAAPLAAGLLFGGPAGIIAGLIGGIERWFAALWGRGMFTRVACSVATMLVGFYAASIRRTMFDSRKPHWSVAMAIGVVGEVLHLLLIHLTNLDQPERAFTVVRACSAPMITANAISVALSVAAVTLLDRERLNPKGEERPITQGVQRGMLASMVLALIITTAFSALLQGRVSAANTANLLNLNIEDVVKDVASISDERLLSLTRRAVSSVRTVGDATPETLVELKDLLGVAEISVVDAEGIIVCSSEPDYVGFDMHSGTQAAEFLEVLPGGSLLELVQVYQPISRDGSVWRKYAAARIEGGLIQLGYDADQFQSDISESIGSAVMNRHIGAGGFLVVVDGTGRIFSEDPGLNGHQTSNIGLESALVSTDFGELYRVNLNGIDYYGAHQAIEGYEVVALQPVAEADLARNTSLTTETFMKILVFALLFTVGFFMIKRTVVNSIRSINSELGRITGGDLDVVVDARSTEEFAELSDGINSTVDTLKRYISEAEARIDQELEYARGIQRGALPSVFPPFPAHSEFEIYASMEAAKEVGGDFYDFYLIDEDHLAFAIADVSGKGIPAAMFMMRAKTVLKSFAESGLMVQDVLTCGNEQLCEGNESNMFVTAWMGVLDLRTGQLEFANAGHNPPAVRRADGSFELAQIKRRPPLACIEGTEYMLEEAKLEPGDTIFLYTDGITEANNIDEQLYGEARLVDALNGLPVDSMQGLIEGVRADVADFVGEADQFDDMTMLALRFDGRP